jgi:hypothetical protein
MILNFSWAEPTLPIAPFFLELSVPPPPPVTKMAKLLTVNAFLILSLELASLLLYYDVLYAVTPDGVENKY